MSENKIIKTEYSEEMQKSFIDYSMSVIVSRALPDVRDGLKPVQRRTLYDMYELGIRYDKPYRKCARIVGDTMGKYHPHGDSSIYDALVVMSQDFKRSEPLIDGHGNFGNIEGDGAAAMRYTEARLQKITQEAILGDLDKNVVDFVPNFDETEKEPEVLPARFSNLLVNGSEGIAVGMATSVPPHNLSEVTDATIAYMHNENITTKELMNYIEGPDFPTGGIITNRDELLSIYETGTGKIKVRGKVTAEKGKNGRVNLVITEIPYTMTGAGMGKFLSDVADLAESRKSGEIVDITNQSSKDGIRIVIELKRDTDVKNFTNLLYKKTKLEDTFGVNMLAINDGRPETMGLKGIIKASVDFQYEINTRKYTNLLAKEKEKREIQEGLIKACNVIDLIIEILRGSRDRQTAKRCLTEGNTDGIKFRSKESKIMAGQLNFTDKQADAILDMRLCKLIGLELDALIKEHDQTLANISHYEDILSRKDSMAEVIIKDLEDIKKKFGKKRRTKIINADETVYKEKEPEDVDLYFVMDRFGYVKTIDPATYERNAEAMQEFKFVFRCKSSSKICLFTDTGQMYSFRISDIPFGKFRDKGVPVDNVSAYSSDREEILLITDLADIISGKLIFVTDRGMIKTVNGSEFDVSRRSVAATTLMEEDRLVNVHVINKDNSIVLKSRGGYFLRIPVKEVSEKKKAAVGVQGMSLSDNDGIERVWYLPYGENSVKYDEKDVSVKSGKRGGKGTKIKI